MQVHNKCYSLVRVEGTWRWTGAVGGDWGGPPSAVRGVRQTCFSCFNPCLTWCFFLCLLVLHHFYFSLFLSFLNLEKLQKWQKNPTSFESTILPVARREWIQWSPVRGMKEKSPVFSTEVFGADEENTKKISSWVRPQTHRHPSSPNPRNYCKPTAGGHSLDALWALLAWPG